MSNKKSVSLEEVLFACALTRSDITVEYANHSIATKYLCEILNNRYFNGAVSWFELYYKLKDGRYYACDSDICGEEYKYNDMEGNNQSEVFIIDSKDNVIGLVYPYTSNYIDHEGFFQAEAPHGEIIAETGMRKEDMNCDYGYFSEMNLREFRKTIFHHYCIDTNFYKHHE